MITIAATYLPTYLPSLWGNSNRVNKQASVNEVLTIETAKWGEIADR